MERRLGLYYVLPLLFLFVPGTLHCRPISGFQKSVDYHVDIPAWPDYQVDYVFQAASSLISDIEIISECQDVGACVELKRLGSIYAWGTQGDLHDIIDSNTEAVQILTSPGADFRIVAEIHFGGNDFAGLTCGICPSSIIAANDAAPDTWAHEFGHQKGLRDNISCRSLIMCSDTLGYICALSLAEVAAGEVDSFEARPDYTSHDCNPKGESLLRYFTAVHETDGNHITFATYWEFDSDSFAVEKFDAQGGSAGIIGSVLAAGGSGGSAYSIVDAYGVTGDRYKLVERQNGTLPDLSIGTCIAQEPFTGFPVEPATYNTDSLAAAVMALDDPLVDVPQIPPDPCISLVLSPPQYAILCPDVFADSLGSYATLWRNRGIRTSVIPFSLVDSCAGSFVDYIHSAASHGLQYVLLVGDANDAVWWDDSLKWPSPWSWPRFWTCCPLAHNGSHYPSQPGRNLIPTFYYSDTETGESGMSWWTPYYASDLRYADVDGDGLPDIQIGRLPAGSVDDVAAYTAKLSWFLSSTGNAIFPTAYHLTYAEDNGGASGAQTLGFADSVAARFPPGVSLTRYSVTNENWKYSHGDSVAKYAANSGTGLILWMSTRTDRNLYAGFWNLWGGWSLSSLSIPPRPFVSLALSCDMGDIDRTEDDCNYGEPFGPSSALCSSDTTRVRPIVERLLFDPRKGAILQIGPSRASYQRGHLYFGEELVKRIYEPGMNVGRAFLLAQRTCLLNHPEYAAQFRSYMYLGDPLIGSATLTAVPIEAAPSAPARLDPPAPNPFNPDVILTLRVSQVCRVRLEIYDIQGHLVRSLVRDKIFSPGSYRRTWNGRSESGALVGSGVYFARLVSDGVVQTRKLAIIR